ncbi:rabankyrin-5-like [Coccinella septempunctata]|uniref:rabankyrin-5-like n=1 Tax=Coccinella septempunctata TaxID=41139 RepID=UPI001D06F0B7|nr:rabankyrin-5-like [Coccinella septempunctata]
MEVNKYKQIYIAASKNNVKQLNCLLEQEIEDGNLDDLLSKVCMELELNRVHLSDDIKQILERKLMSLRFFHKQSKFYLNSQEVRDHIQFMIQLINSLETCKDKDELFIGNLTFIAKQIFTLKRLLKSTYDRLPWEEIEFCILSYIRTFKDQNEIALFSRAILSKSNLITYLESFGKHLENLLNYVLIMRPQELSRLPNLKRDEVVEDIIDKYPEFKSLYDDHERIRDIHSLNIMLNYVELVRSIGLGEKNGIFILMRALQVIGEHLKNTLKSPKLTQTIINYLFTFFSQSTRNLVIKLRNTLAHRCLSKHVELFENIESNFFSGIKNDIEKLGGQIGYILSKYKMKVVIELGDKFLNTNDEKVMKEVASVMKNFGTGKVLREDLSELKNNDITRLKDLIDQYRCKIKGKCVYSEILFEAIDQSFKNVQIGAPTDYGSALLLFHSLYEKFYMMIGSSHNKSSYISSMKYSLKHNLKTLSPQIESFKLCETAEMIISIHSLSSESQEDEVWELFYKIIYIIKFEVNSIQWTEKFGRKIKKRDMEVETFNSENSEEVTKMKKQEKFNQLREIFDGVTYTQFKSNKKLQAVVEIFLLDLIPMLKYDHFKAKYFLNDNYPSLTGVDLRNHLAHNNVIVEVLLDSTSAIFLFVEKLLEVEGKSDDLNLTEVQYFNLSRMKNSYATTVDILNRKHNMFVALKENNFDAFSECIKEGADIRSRDTDLSTCLHFAMRRPKTIKLTKFLLKEGLSTFKMKNLENQSPLHIAVTKTNLEVVEFLLKNFDTDINEIDSFQRTPAHLAAFSGNEHILNSLWNHGADFTKKDYLHLTPLQYAALSGKPSAVQFFFNKDLFYKLDEAFGGFTTLYIAAEEGLVEIVNYLLSKNVKVDAKNDVGVTPVQRAALNGHLETVKALIRAGADVNSSNMNGNCALEWACETGREEIVKVLIQNGADVNVRDYANNFAPINYLAKHGYIGILRIFLENGADVNVTTKDGLTPLLYAVEGRHLEIVDLLMQQDGIEVNRSNIHGTTPLHGASMNGDVEIVRLLIMKGADLDCRNLEGMTPLHFACKHGHEAVVDLLIEHGVSIHAETSIRQWLPLHMAAESGNENIMIKLIRKGSQINATTSKGANCLHIAVRNGRNILDLLIRFGVDIHAKTKDRGFTPLHEAVIANSLQMVKCLLNAGAHIDDQDNAGNTPIHLAIERDSNEISVFLFKNGARIDLSNKMDKTPFLSAVKYNRATLIQMFLSSRLIQDELIFKDINNAIFEGNTNVVRLLLKHAPHLDLSVYWDEDQNTPLHIASMFGRVDVVEMLLGRGVVVDSKNVYGITPLFSAASRGFDEIVEMLLKKGATINPQDRDGSTPLHLVSETNYERMVEFLLNHGADVNVLDNKNRLPIELAVSEGRITSVKLFLEKNKSFLNRRVNQNFSLLHIATQFGHKEIVKFLLDEGADMHLTNDKGSKAIHIAAREGFTDIIDVFLEKGMDLDVRGAANQSMLHYAASTGRLEVVKYLVERGCDVNTVNEGGISALNVAANQGHMEVVKYLLNKGAIYIMV